MSSDEEDLSRFREAVDPTYFTDQMFKSNPSEAAKSEITKKSNRYLEGPSHYNDVVISSIAQRQIADKIDKIIKAKVEFIDKTSKKVINRETRGGVRLFSDSDTVLTDLTMAEGESEEKIVQKRPIIKRRRVDEESVTSKRKIVNAAISPTEVLSKKSTELWVSRRKPKLFRYEQVPNSNILKEIVS